MNIKSLVRDIPDFPKPGIVFKDITPLLQNQEAFQYIVQSLAVHYQNHNIDVIMGIESRGFIFAAPLAYAMGKSLSLVRKKGKLPYKTISHTYDLEYGSDTIEIHEDAVKAGDRVLLVDDLLATGGTANATAQLIEKMGANLIEIAFVIELEFLKGREKLKDHPIFSLIQF